MEIVNASYEILDELSSIDILRKIELCGRVCYKSEDRITDDSAEKFVRTLIASGHESVLEHVSFSVRFVCDRGVSHEIVRHRLASYSQESTRYCNYEGRMQFISPCFWDDGVSPKKFLQYESWREAMETAEGFYLDRIASGASLGEARSILPNSLKTELIMTANLREWRWFLRQRASPRAHPQMRELTVPLLAELQEKLPAIFDSI